MLRPSRAGVSRAAALSAVAKEFLKLCMDTRKPFSAVAHVCYILQALCLMFVGSEDLVDGGSVVGGPRGAGWASWISFLRL